MTTEISTLMAAAAEPTVAVVRGIRDDQLGDATPCTEYQVRDLLNHLFQVVVAFQGAAKKEPLDMSSTPDSLTEGWRDRFAEETERMIAAWSDPAALEGVSPGMGMPQAMIGNLALADLTVHGWDLATATKQPYRPDAGAVQALVPFVEQMAPTGRQMGAFGEEVQARADAGDFERLLALSGRQA
ncbi:TIGR03086 family protein [Actinoplanes sp. LDG1-06]|uniref:TIGR03086 family protein n=1 Tax=Paractinoplanes ovalisporus TaxID=2810368 RepID=A0ABS2A6E7_9ACTN|nr:TIGR03086 family metal-binding protein [Actinoplanes ovalisporus]MBM2615416.1 TIGR03086 family protein [Actinoplanes ovalisporus]